MSEAESNSVKDRLYRLKRATPFVPFSIELQGGRRLQVPDRLSVGWGRTEATVVDCGESMVHFKVSDIARIEESPAVSK